MPRRYASRDNPVLSTTPVGPRDYGQTTPVRPPSTTVLCWCKAHYVDDDEGHQAHRTVFSHEPASRLGEPPPEVMSPEDV